MKNDEKSFIYFDDTINHFVHQNIQQSKIICSNNELRMIQFQSS
jgi:hypothetical protein